MSGQQLEFNYVGDKLGLPAQECYNVMQDSKGYLWISTEAGLCRYNGVNSIIFNKANGLSDNDCYSVIENKDKTIWVLTSSNRIFKIKDKLIEEAPFSKNYACGLDGGLKQGYSMNFINDSLIINTQSSTLSIALNTCKIKAILPPKALSYNFQKVNNTLLCYKSVDNIIMTGQEASKGVINISITTSELTKSFTLPYFKKEALNWRVLTTTNKKNESFIAIGNILLKMDANLNYKVFDIPYQIISLYSDNENGLWVGTVKGGVYFYRITQSMDKVINNLSGYSVSGTCVDYEKGAWCTTIEKGVFYCANKSVLNYRDNGLNKPADLLKAEAGRVFQLVLDITFS